MRTRERRQGCRQLQGAFNVCMKLDLHLMYGVDRSVPPVYTAWVLIDGLASG